MDTMRLADVAVVPEPDDNVAIATRTLPAGTLLDHRGALVELPHDVPEGHRLVVRAAAEGEPLLSWSTPFARALRGLRPGEYVCTARSLDAMRARGTGGLPGKPSARDEPLEPYRLDESALRLGEQVDPVATPGTFLGFARPHGVAGTRNHIAVIALTSRGGAFVTEVARRFAGRTWPGFDGVVPVAHTEGGEDGEPNNVEFLLAALAGFAVHPNVGAVLVVDEPGSSVDAARLRAYLHSQDYPPLPAHHAFLTRSGAFADDLADAVRIVEGWLAPVGALRRTERPLSELRIALQCGGSDAFSGISANPLAGAVAREVIRHGGAAVLAETDELIGAEGYVLDNVRSVEVARRFVAAVAAFQDRVGRHGHSAEGNPSGGNLYRGLYNIVLKSVGAARKLDRALRLDHVVGYGEPLPGNGFAFMDSPGNDLESVAGQVASGCNLVFFTTGNGSITNFPFVPTLKFVTTTPRYELLRHEMDVDAGRFLTGTPMDTLTGEVFDQTVRAASGEPTAGERAGHSQVSIWRDWRQTEPSEPSEPVEPAATGRPRSVALGVPNPSAELRDAPLPGLPLSGVATDVPGDLRGGLTLLAADGRRAAEHVGLVLPTSLCSGQVALRIAERAEAEGWLGDAVSRVVALPHTEGCGASSGASEETYARVMLGHLTHPSVRAALLLEHGCEKTHNDYFRSRLVESGADPARFGWAGIQRDGGIEAVSERVRAWFASRARTFAPPEPVAGDLGELTVAVEARGEVAVETAESLARLGCWLVAAGGSVLLGEGGALLRDTTFRSAAFGDTRAVSATLAHGQRPAEPGWHVMRTPGTDWLETATGFGACGADIVLAHVTGATLTAPRLAPLVQVSGDSPTVARYGADLDASLTGDAGERARDAFEALLAVASRERPSRARATGNVGFQVTRGLLGTSL